MSKHEREPQPYAFVIENGEQKLICTPDNTRAYLYEDSKKDHLFHILGETEESYWGIPIYRKHLGDQFDKVVKKMINNGFLVENTEEMTESDWENYYKAYPEDRPLPHPEENWGNTKHMKAENWGGFLAHIMEQIANGEREDY